MAGGRVIPLNRQAEDAIIDFELWHRDAMQDGRIDEREAQVGISKAMAVIGVLRFMVGTWGFVKAALDSAKGIYSPKVQRGFRETVARDNIIPFPAVDGDEAA